MGLKATTRVRDLRHFQGSKPRALMAVHEKTISHCGRGLTVSEFGTLEIGEMNSDPKSSSVIVSSMWKLHGFKVPMTDFERDHVFLEPVLLPYIGNA